MLISHKHMAEDTQKNNLFFSINQIPNMYTNMSAGILDAVNVVQQVNASMLKFTENIINFNKSIQSIFPDLSKLADFIDNITKFREIEKKVLIESGWFICPSLDPVPYSHIRLAVVNYESGRRDSVTRLMKSIYGDKEWQYLGETIKKWEKNRFFNGARMRIINHAFDAHKKGLYTLSIPALLPIVEGISGDFCSEQEMNIDKSRTKQKVQVMLGELNKNGKIYLSEVVLSFIENQLYVKTDDLKKSKNKKYLNRHAILHGSYTGYADCARSLRCFLLLDVLTLL